ncbi:MAG: hypothetical protein EOP84_10645 [Verrucomicrobiaceae bacterium]|nr:MAG: hypothetical protein EOP84_10645 [Verrucomicrobiaceae bacterium]
MFDIIRRHDIELVRRTAVARRRLLDRLDILSDPHTLFQLLHTRHKRFEGRRLIHVFNTSIELFRG